MENTCERNVTISSMVGNIFKQVPFVHNAVSIMNNGKDEYQVITCENESLKSTISHMEEHICDLENKLQGTQEFVQQCQKQLLNKNQFICKLQHKTIKLEQQLASWQKTNNCIGAEYKQQINVMENQLEDNHQSITAIEHTLEEYKIKYQMSREKIAENENVIVGLQELITKYESDTQGHHIELSCMKYKLNQMQTDLNNRSQQLHDITLSHQQAEQQLKLNVLKLSEKDSMMIELNATVAKYNIENEQLQKDLHTSLVQSGKYLEQLNKCKACHSYTNTEVDELLDQIYYLKCDLEESSAKTSHIQRQLKNQVSNTKCFRDFVPCISTE